MLTDEGRDGLFLALGFNQLRTVLRLIVKAGERALDADRRAEIEWRLAVSSLAEKRQITQDGLRVAKLIGNLGDCISAKKPVSDVVALVDELVRLGGLASGQVVEVSKSIAPSEQRS